MKKNPRLQAFFILHQLIDTKTPLSHLLQNQADLPPLAKEICFGVCRQFYRLQAIADHLLKKRPNDQRIWLIILLGLYQLHFMKKPDYAVVKETVDLLDQVKLSWAKALVNAVLRRFCREQAEILLRLEKTNEFIYNHPAWFVKRLQKDWPQAWQTILAANDSHPPLSLRVNQQQITREDYLVQLEKMGHKARQQAFSAVGITLDTPCPINDLPGFVQGLVSVQDESAQLAAYLLDLKPNLRVLDACCAPGGKTCHILEQEPNLQDCVALDVDEKRLARVKDNLSRLGLSATLLKGDGLHPETWWDGQRFDRILLDAPCSATGVIRRHPDIKLLRTEAEINRVATLQGNLLTRLWPLLAPQGILVFATCSVLKQENCEQIKNFLLHVDDAELSVDDKPWGENTGFGWQIFPTANQGDGFFYCKITKK